MNSWYLVFPYAAVVSVLARALAAEEIFKEPRECLRRCHADESRPLLLRKLAYLPTCEFCSSFWISLAVVAGLFDYRLALDDWRGYVVSVLTVMALANLYLAVFSLLRVDLRRGRATAEWVENRKTA